MPNGQGFSILGRVLEKIQGSGLGLDRVGVLKDTIGYFQVFLGIFRCYKVNWISSVFFVGSEPTIKFFSNIY